jgi:hypothetical protein
VSKVCFNLEVNDKLLDPATSGADHKKMEAYFTTKLLLVAKTLELVESKDAFGIVLAKKPLREDYGRFKTMLLAIWKSKYPGEVYA